MTYSPWKRWARLCCEASLEILAPLQCVLCSADATPEGLCAACHPKLALDRERRCVVCAAPTTLFNERGRCLMCRHRRPAFSRLDAVADYVEPWRNLVQRLKYRAEVVCARPLARRLASFERSLLDNEPSLRADLIVTMPLTRSRQRERGFNQVSLLARELAEVEGCALGTRNLQRCDDGRQAGTSRAQRRRLSATAFSAESVYARRILLVDDVVTTGATLRAASRALIRSGARDVRALVLARTPSAP